MSGCYVCDPEAAKVDPDGGPECWPASVRLCVEHALAWARFVERYRETADRVRPAIGGAS